MTSTETNDDTAALAERVFAAIEAGDLDAVSRMWADDVEVWHNDDGVVQTKGENLKVLGWIVRNTASRAYLDVVRHVHADGFAQRHVLRLEFDDGRTADIPAAIFVGVRAGQVVRVDEYLDSAHVATAFAR
ncbi:nuclear transport factor 2 family protein [Ilumatobacter sp.]|uniref:nuclear transport factor 2 family protein n=1 Tax=Ilumatobacter sp. TaxID=1967498 RepID=UPI003B5179FB